MKRFLLLCGVGVAQVAPLAAHAQVVAAETGAAAGARTFTALSRPVTVALDGVPLKQALATIAASAKVRVLYNTDVLNAVRTTVSLRVTNIPLGTALDRALAGTHMGATAVSNDLVMIGPVDGTRRLSQAKTGTIRGQVADSATGRGVARAAVSVVGTTYSAMTTDNGAFTLPNVPEGDQVLTIKLLGYRSASRNVSVVADGQVSVNVILAPAATVLSGVVTTATGAARRIEVGNDITVLKVDSIMKTAPITSVTDLLEARVPGMTVQRTSGTPGDPARIRLRGTSSVYQNNDPIIIVDGVRMYGQQSDDRNVSISSGLNANGRSVPLRAYNTPSPLDQIDPNTIETIEVFKGPSASSMYGSDAANGVIVITTKRGQSGPARWNVRANTGTTYLPGSWPDGTWKWVSQLHGGGSTLCVAYCGDARVDSIVKFQALNHPRLTALGRGNTFGGGVTVTGGSPQVTYSFTGSASNANGILKLPEIEEERYLRFQGEPAPDWMRRPDRLNGYGAQGSVQVQVTPTMTLAVSSTLNNQTQHRTSMSNSLDAALNKLQRIYVDLSQLNETPILGNPYERVISGSINQVNSVQLNVRRWSWMPFTVTFGTNTLTQSRELSLARGLITTSGQEGGSWSGSTNVASGVTANGFTTIPLSRLLSLALGANFDRGRTNDQSGTFRGIPEDVTDPSAGLDTARNQFTRATTERKSFGWFMEPKLNISSRLFVMPGFRLDNNGLAGRNAKFNGLPKMSVSWVASEESFFPIKRGINQLRVRTAFGVSGVQPRPGDLNRLYQRIDGNPLSGTEPFYGEMLDLQYLGNTQLRPERGIELEGGFDLDAWDNRLNTTVTYWRKRRKDAIIPNQYAASIDGGQTLGNKANISMNVGDLSNSGLELTLGTQLIQRRALRLSLSTTYSRQRSNVERLNNAGAFDLGYSAFAGNFEEIRYVVGYPVEGLWALPILGYADRDGNGWITESEIVFGTEHRFMGTAEPAHQASFAPTLTLLGGRFSVNATLSYVGGQTQSLAANSGDLQLSPYENGIVQGPDGFDRQAAWVGMRRTPASKTFVGYMQKINAVRFQSLSFNVNLGTSAARFVKARSASVALQGSNLGLWTNYIGVDPNVNGALGGRGLVDSGQQPQPREWRLNLSLGY